MAIQFDRPCLNVLCTLVQIRALRGFDVLDKSLLAANSTLNSRFPFMIPLIYILFQSWIQNGLGCSATLDRIVFIWDVRIFRKLVCLEAFPGPPAGQSLKTQNSIWSSSILPYSMDVRLYPWYCNVVVHPLNLPITAFYCTGVEIVNLALLLSQF